MKVYPPRDIRPFVLYCVNGKPRSSLLIESTDSMIIINNKIYKLHDRYIVLKYECNCGEWVESMGVVGGRG